MRSRCAYCEHYTCTCSERKPPKAETTQSAYQQGWDKAQEKMEPVLAMYKSRVKWLEDRVAWLERENRQWAEMTKEKA